MPVNRFFLEQELKGVLLLLEEEHHHLSHVMRLKPKDKIELVNGKGSLAQAIIVEVRKKETVCQVSSVENIPPPSSFLHLAIPFMRMPKLELVFEKCTELGADVFHLYSAHYSEKKELSEHQLKRLRHILISSLKQCGRFYLPSIQIQSFETLFDQKIPIFFGDLKGEKIPENKGGLLFISGPEKGFSESEHSILRQKKAKAVCLSQNTLRAETAPIAASCLFC